MLEFFFLILYSTMNVKCYLAAFSFLQEITHGVMLPNGHLPVLLELKSVFTVMNCFPLYNPFPQAKVPKPFCNSIAIFNGRCSDELNSLIPPRSDLPS